MAKIITSLQHPLVKHLVRLRENRKDRETYKSTVIEGSVLISELSKKYHLKTLVAVDESQIPPKVSADEVLLVTDAIMKKISGVQTPEGLLAEIALPDLSSLKGLKWIVAFDGVSDPGNMGTLLRSALALGWEGAFLLKNSCDPFNDKALRAAKGATFRLPLRYGTWDDLKAIIEENHLRPLVADMHGTPVDNIDKQKGILLVLSNEAHGISKEAEQVCERVSIPMPGEMESLNVAIAGALLMYVLKLSDE